MIRSILTVGVWTMASRVLGFVRDVLIASSLGAGLVADAFFVALRLPNLFRRLFGEGAFNAAFVPQFAAMLRAEGHDAARRFASQTFSLMAFWLTTLTVAGIAAMPLVVGVIAPGFAALPEKFDLAVDLSRITFPYLVLICLAALMSGILNALDRFAVASATGVVFNVTLIAALLGLTPLLATGGHALAWGVAVSGILQLGLVMTAAYRAGMGMRLVRPSLSPELRRLLRRMGPGVIGGGVTQLNLAVDVVIASLLPAGTVSFLYYADRIQQLPLGVIGTAIGTAMLPALSRQVAGGEGAVALDTQNRAIEYAMILTLPAAVALVVIPWPIIWTLFGHGAFDAQSARLTAEALAAYAIGLPAFVMIKVLAPGFFARGDTMTPVKVAGATVVAHLAMNLAFMVPPIGPLSHLGPPLATSLAAILTATSLWILLVRRRHLRADRRLGSRMIRLVPAVGTMAVSLWAMERVLFRPDLGLAPRLVALAVMTVGGMAVYALAVRMCGVATMREIMGAIRRR